MHHFLHTLFLLFFLSTNAVGQQPYFKNYQPRDGLPSNNVYYVFQDSKGYIWFCTDVGVSRFDGAHFTNYTTVNGLSDNEVFSCFEDDTGRLWFATLNGKPCFFEKEKIWNERSFPILENLNLGGMIQKIFQLENGGLVISAGNRFLIVDVTNWNFEEFAIPDSFVHLWKEKKDTIGMLNGNKIGFYYDGEFFKKDTVQFALPPIKTKVSGGFVFISMVNNLLIYNKLKKEIAFDMVVPNEMNEAIAINVYPTHFWLGTRNGAHLFDRSSRQLEQSYLLGEQVSFILEDREGGWWFSTLEHGVFYAPAPEIRQLIPASGQPVGKVNCLTKDAAGRLWSGLTNSANGVLEKGFFDVYHNFPKKLIPRSISNIREMADGSMLLVGKAGLLRLKNEKKRFFFIRGNDVIVDKDGTWWSGMKGVYRYSEKEVMGTEIVANDITEPKAIVLINLQEHLPRTLIRTDKFLLDEKGRVWVASPLGLYYFENNSFVGPLISHNIQDFIFEENKKIIWVLTESNGLFAMRDMEFIDSINIAANNQASDICFDFCQDGDGNFWVATATGLRKIEGAVGNLNLVDYSNVYGLGAEKLNAVEVMGQNVYLGKDDGLIEIPVSIFSKKNLAPPVYLKNVTVNEGKREAGDGLNLSSDENAISFSFEGLSYKDYKNLNYRYRLQGYEEEWHTTSSEMVEYASLRPGSYHFEVYAQNGSGVESEGPAAVNFTVAKPIWIEGWFISAVLIGMAGLVYVWVRRRELRLRRRFDYQRRLMEAENGQLELQKKNTDLRMLALRLQMNPHFVFNALNTIKGYYGQEKIKQANRYISKFARLLRLNLDYSDSFIPLEKEIDLLKIYLQLFQIRYPDKINFNLAHDSEISLSTTLIPSMVLQPFVENALIHGLSGKEGGGLVEVLFAQSGQEIIATVRDDGIGRAAASEKNNLKGPHKPLATAITLERLELLRKDNRLPAVVIHDLVDAEGRASGTEVVIRLPKEKI